MKLRMYKESDYDRIGDCVEPLSAMELVRVKKNSGVHLTLTHKKKILACGGIIITNEDEGCVWLRLTQDICKNKIDLIRMLKAGQKIIEESFGLKKLCAYVKDSFPVGRRFAEHFGFHRTDETFESAGHTFRVYTKCQDLKSHS